MTALTVPDVLRRAEQEVAQRGLCKGDFTDEAGRVCALGAINVAVWGEPWTEGMDDDQWLIRSYAIAKLDLYLDESAVRWNDRPERTEVEVRAALLAAAQRAEAGQADRPYRCEGCGKTSRIARHEPGCPVAAAFDREAGTE